MSLLLAQINRTPFLWLEDVFTIGLLRANAGIKITSLEAKKNPDRSDKSQTETDSRNLGPSQKAYLNIVMNMQICCKIYFNI